MPDDSTSPQAIAIAQVAVIRDALYVLSRPATVAELVEYVNLPVDVVKRRLNQNGSCAYRPEFQIFKFDKSSGLWTLTGLGKWVAEEAAKGLS